jgi:hypothetical protein
MVADGEISKTCPGEVTRRRSARSPGAHKAWASRPTWSASTSTRSISDQLASLARPAASPTPNNPQGFYETTSQIELQAAMQQIVDDTLSCVIDVDPEPSEPELFQVWIGKDAGPRRGRLRQGRRLGVDQAARADRAVRAGLPRAQEVGRGRGPLLLRGRLIGSS